MALLAFCARYGHQPLSELRAMTLSELQAFGDALSDILRKESQPSGAED